MRMACLIALMLFGLAGPFTAPALAQDAPNYRSLVDRIDALLAEARDSYAAGETEAAKTAVQRSYFELFENLEGPIRVNVSAQRSYELEAEFGDIRQLIIDGAPVEQVSQRIDAHVAALDALVPKLEQGFVLRAEPAVGESAEDAAPNPEPAMPAVPQTVEPYWEQAVAGIQADLNAAADALEAGNPDEAKRLIQQAQFEGYKNSLLETAIRRHVSQTQDIAYNAEFTRILGLVDDGRPARLIRGSARVMAEDMSSHLPGLPLVGVAKDRAASMPEPEVDWAAVAGQVNAAVARAIDLAAAGDATGAVSLLQDTYFDVFEASGMESRIGARDTTLKATLEGHFSKLMAQARADAPRGDMTATAEAMQADLAGAVAMLDPASGGGWLALFGYALLIILREGFEAILIVTAIVTYLVKTGHSDKQGVIVNSVVVALLASVVTAVLLELVFQASAASQEVLEGGTMLLAAVILFTMSYWLVSKAEAAKWMAYIKGKVDSSLSSGSLKALWFTSFLAVYREGAETVLFFQALTTDADATGLMGVAGGFVVGCVALGFVYWAMRAGALRLPIRPFFQVTGALLYAMAFVFAGKGIMELVEGKVLSPTLVSWVPEIPALGVYPYWESLLPQVALVAAALVALVVISRQRARQPAVVSGESA